MNRALIFDQVRIMLKRGFTTAEVKALDAAIDEATGTIVVTAPKDAFSAALDILLHHEGGYVNHPKDPGGRTNLGVTQRVWEEWTGKPANEAIMRALTRKDVAPLYREQYWERVRGDEIPPGIALSAFDFAVNAGPTRAIRTLQATVNVNVDGILGPNTLAAIQAGNDATMVRIFAAKRRSFYRSLSTFATFGKGWMRRVDAVEKAALELAK